MIRQRLAFSSSDMESIIKFSRKKKSFSAEVLINSSNEIKSIFTVLSIKGTIGSAQLLMLSGVGPKEHLEGLHIPVVKDLPTGNNGIISIDLSIRLYLILKSIPNLRECFCHMISIIFCFKVILPNKVNKLTWAFYNQCIPLISNDRSIVEFNKIAK